MKYFAHMKLIILFGTSLLLIFILISGAAFINKKNETLEKHTEVILREIGHKLLLTAKDSSSRVLPVKKVNEHTYQISFQNETSFAADTLINLFEREFRKRDLAKDYIINLRNCKQRETVFAFEINGKTGNITPCNGRSLETGCYFIEIDFLKTARFYYLWLLLLVIPLGFAGFYIKNKLPKIEKPISISDDNDFIQLGRFKFLSGNNVLKMENETITLSEKETKALKIFAENIDQMVEREKLMKAIWEDEGIIVMSRNVDVLVSKLRKKLSKDDSIKFINVHGRGYRLIIE